MIVPAPVARAIARGAATTIRVPVDTREHQPRVVKGRTVSTAPRRYATGERLSLRGGVWVEITAVERGPLGTPTMTEALDAGYPDAESFARAWVEQHDRSWVTTQETYLAKVDDPDRDALLDGLLLHRYSSRWQDTPVWVLTVQPVEVDRYLASSSDELYATSRHRALSGEDAPAVSAEEQARQTEAAKHRKSKHDRARQKEREQRDLDTRIQNLVVESKRRGIPISDQVKLIRKMLRAGRNEQAVLLELRRAEIKVNQEAA